MARRDFDTAILKAQGVPPRLAEHIACVFEKLMLEDARLKRRIASAKRRAFKAGWNARSQSETS